MVSLSADGISQKGGHASKLTMNIHTKQTHFNYAFEPHVLKKTRLFPTLSEMLLTLTTPMFVSYQYIVLSVTKTLPDHGLIGLLEWRLQLKTGLCLGVLIVFSAT